MIIKQLTRKVGANPGQLVEYVLRYTIRDGKQAEKKEFMTVLAHHNLRSSTVEGIVKEFKQNEEFRIYKRKNNIGLFHTTISFSPKDKQKISIVNLKDIAEKFIELRGTNNLHLAVAHMEKNHAHTHIITSGVATNGRSSRLSKQSFKNLLKELELYQREKYPELIHSKNSHEKANGLNKESFTQYLKERRKTNTLSLHTELCQLLKKAQSIEALTEQLITRNKVLYYRNGKPQGIISDGKKYRFSSLGIEPEAISVLSDKGSRQNNVLDELQAIRSREEQSKKQEIEEEVDASYESVDQELQSLRKVRERTKVFEGLEREFTQVPLLRGMGISP